MAGEEEQHSVDVESAEIAAQLRAKVIDALSCEQVERLLDDNFHTNDQVWVALRQAWESTRQADLSWESSELQGMVVEYADLEHLRAEAESNLLVSKLEVQTACASAGGLAVSKLAGVLEEAVRFRSRCRQLGQQSEQVLSVACDCLEQSGEQRVPVAEGRVSIVPADAIFCPLATDDIVASHQDTADPDEHFEQVQEAATTGDLQDPQDVLAADEQREQELRQDHIARSQQASAVALELPEPEQKQEASAVAFKHLEREQKREDCSAGSQGQSLTASEQRGRERSQRIAGGAGCGRQLDAFAEPRAAASAAGDDALPARVRGGLCPASIGGLGPGISAPSDFGRCGLREPGGSSRETDPPFSEMEYVELDSEGADLFPVRRSAGSTQQFCKVLVDLFRVGGTSHRGQGS